MKKLSLLLTILTAGALFACLQAAPVNGPVNGVQQSEQHTQAVSSTQPKKKSSSGVTVIIWP